MQRRAANLGYASFVTALVFLSVPLTAAAQEPNDAAVRARLQPLMWTKPSLRGAWVEFDSSDKKQWKFDLTVDSDRAESQVAEIKEVIRQLVPKGQPYVIDPEPRKLPVSELVSELQDEIDAESSLAGCLIEGVFFQPEPKGAKGQLVLVLFGRRSAANERLTPTQTQERITEKCRTLMERDPRWLDPRTKALEIRPTTNATKAARSMSMLEPVAPSAAAAALFFADGLQHYQACSFREAARYFRLAAVEAPERIEYRYCQIAAYLANGEEARAYRLLWPLVLQQRMNLTPAMPPTVYAVMERMQGPVRAALERLTARAWEECVTLDVQRQLAEMGGGS